MIDTTESAILVDAHVHIYDCFDVDVLLDAASRNFTYAAKKLRLAPGFTGVLLLAETSYCNWFQRTREKCRLNQQFLAVGKLSHWQIDETSDKTVLKARRFTGTCGDENYIYIMAGRQIITAEGLELLALMTDSTFEDGLSITSLLNAVREQGSIPVLPWAAGKWLGKRGKMLSDLLKAEADSDLCIGDNSGRPALWRNPLHFQQAKKSNMGLLPGTDPLPFSSEVGRVGSFGFMMPVKLTDVQPSDDLKQLLRSNALQVTAYGRLETTLGFIVNQIRLRIC